MKYTFSEESRRNAVKDISIKYVKLKKLANQYRDEYIDARIRCLLPKFYLDVYDKYQEYEDKCFNLDISLGLIVKQGDYETIPEYREAIKIG